MGSPLEAAEGCSYQFMYSLLDYSTWRIYSDGVEVGGVTLNSSDRSVAFWALDFESELTEFLSQRSFDWWVKWIQRHQPMAD